MISSNKIVTVIGGSGFLGRYIVQTLAKQGFRVRVAVRNPNNALDLTVSGVVGQIIPVQCNIRHIESVKLAIKHSDYVINCVGILCESGKQTFEETQLKGAKNIAEACKLYNIKKLVHISAIGADINSQSRYAQTKAQAENEILKIMPQSTILRPSIIFGTEDNFFNMFASLTSFTPILPLIGGGHTLFQPVYVNDVAKAAIQCMTDIKTNGQTYEIGGPEQVTFKELLKRMLYIIGKKRLLVPIPFFIAKIKAFFLELLPNPLLTIDQVKLLKQDNIVNINAKTLKDLSIQPTCLDAILPTYLRRYRKTGDYDLGKGYTHKTGNHS